MDKVRNNIVLPHGITAVVLGFHALREWRFLPPSPPGRWESSSRVQSDLFILKIDKVRAGHRKTQKPLFYGKWLPLKNGHLSLVTIFCRKRKYLENIPEIKELKERKPLRLQWGCDHWISICLQLNFPCIPHFPKTFIPDRLPSMCKSMEREWAMVTSRYLAVHFCW